MQCHLRIWKRMAAVLARVFTPVTRTQFQNVRKIILIRMQLRMQLIRIPMRTTLKSKNLTGHLILMIRPSTLLHRNPSCSASLRGVSLNMQSVHESPSANYPTATSCLILHYTSMGTGFLREHNACCARRIWMEAKIARIMAKSMYDAKTNVTPKYKAWAIPNFVSKQRDFQVQTLIFDCDMHSHTLLVLVLFMHFIFWSARVRVP